MKKLFNAASKLFTAFFFILLIISSASCRHLQKSQSIKKMGKYLLAVAVVVAVEELAGSELLERIEGAPEDQKPINVTIINENNHEIELGLTNNGHYWKKEILPPKKNVSFESTEKGLVGVMSKGSYFLLKEGKCYKACNENGRIVISEVEELGNRSDSLSAN